MNKPDLIRKVATESGLSLLDAEKAIRAYELVVEKTMKAGDKIVSVGFGTFEIREMAARNGRNPQTGQLIAIPAKRSVRFRPGSKLKF